MTPVPAWFAYSLVVGVLVGLSAWAAEAALRAVGRSGRWVWVWGMGMTLLLPALAVLGSLDWVRSVPAPAGATVIPLVPLAVSAERVGPGISLDEALLGGWALLALVAVSYLVWAYARVGFGGRAGRRAKVDGVEVVVTRGLGPAVFGLRRTSILVPEWALGLDARFRRLMLLHEGEHARAGDGRLVLAALVLAALVPWNVALWWQLARLRTAVELDCDARVLRRIRDRLNYGGLLLEVGRRRSGPVPGVALAERTTTLELRIRRITEATRRPRVRRALWLGGAAGLLLAVAVCTRDPISPPGQPAPAAAVPELDVGALMQGPTFTPFTVAPRLRNPEEVMRTLERRYPPLLRDAGIGGGANVWFLIDETGAVRRTAINESTGYPALDEAALSVAATMVFTPAYNRDRPVPVWVSIPIRFNTAGERPAAPAQPAERTDPAAAQGRTAVSRAELEKAPAFTPFTEAPRLLNAAETARSLEANYPPLLRNAGIGGEVQVWFLIDERGIVQRTLVSKSSGYPALDEAALRVGGTMVFTAAKNRDEPVPVWVSIPIKFTTK